MLKEERQKLILDKLSVAQKINLVELSQQMSVSYDSIRRDVIELEDKGLLKKVHGGAVTNSFLPLKNESGLLRNNQEYGQIIKKAQKLFESHKIILMDGGTTNFYLVEALPKNIELTIITNSLPLTAMLDEHPKVDVILLGGSYHKRYQITVGQEVAKRLQDFRPDLYLMGFNGIHPDSGITLRNYEESIMKQNMMHISRKVAVCAIEEKFNVIESYKVCELRDLDVLVTNFKPNDPILKPFYNNKNGLEII